MGSDTILYVTDVSLLENPLLFEKAYQQLPEERRHKTERFRYPKDRYLSVGAGILLRYVLRYFGIREDAEITSGEYGKPFLKDYSGFHFNLTHSGTYAVCAVSKNEVGCDIEKIGSAQLPLAKRFFAPKEYERLIAQTEEQAQTNLFYRLWTLKESVLKATGKGFSMPLSSFTVMFDENDFPLIAEEPLRTEYKLAEFDVSPDYRCAACVKNPHGSFSLQKLLLSDIL